MNRRELTADDVSFALTCQPEHVPVEGNASAISPEEDAATERRIREQLDSGNEWAWCVAIVTARWNGFEGRDSLGCCSYESAESFRAPGGYFDDMKAAALADLNRAVREAGAALDTLATD